jgi:hypothetical protein
VREKAPLQIHMAIDPRNGDGGLRNGQEAKS